MKATPLLGLFCLLTLSTAPAADIISGRVVDANGIGIPNVNIDAIDSLSGNDENLSGDFTDASGFFTTTIPAGLWDLVFMPPAPPLSTALSTTLPSTVVVGTLNLGTITLPAGIALTGKCVTQSGAPVGGVNLDIIDDTTGVALVLPNDTTDAFGNFSVAVPTIPIEVRLDTRPVFAPILAPTTVNLTPTGTTNLGNIVLPPGFDVSGFVRMSNGIGVSNNDMDVRDSASGDKIWTPGDNTTSTGSFSIRLAAGTWDIEACPKFSTGLLANAIRNVVVTGNINVGTITTAQGVTLTGQITAFDGSIQGGADVDVTDAGGLDVFLCGDNADANGNYSVIIPTGLMTISFEPTSYLVALGADVHTNVNVTGATVLDGVLPSCPGGANYGVGLAGTGGVVPHLTDGGGAPRPGNDAGYFWSLEDGKGAGVGILIISAGQLNLPALGGTLLVNILPGQYSALLVPLGGSAGSAGAGSAQVPIPLPLDQLVGVTLYGQFAVLDSAAPSNVALSEGLAVMFCF